MFLWSSLKTCKSFHTWLLNPLSPIYAGLIPKTAYIRICAKGQILLEFSLTWIWVICLLAFHFHRYHLDLTFHYPIEALYKEPFGYIEEEELKRKKTIVHCCDSLRVLEFASLCPLEHFVLFPSLHLFVSLLSRDGGLKWWRTQFLWFVDMPTEVVTYVISYLLYRNIFFCLMMCI